MQIIKKLTATVCCILMLMPGVSSAESFKQRVANKLQQFGTELKTNKKLVAAYVATITVCGVFGAVAYSLVATKKTVPKLLPKKTYQDHCREFLSFAVENEHLSKNTQIYVPAIHRTLEDPSCSFKKEFDEYNNKFAKTIAGFDTLSLLEKLKAVADKGTDWSDVVDKLTGEQQKFIYYNVYKQFKIENKSSDILSFEDFNETRSFLYKIIPVLTSDEHKNSNEIKKLMKFLLNPCELLDWAYSPFKENLDIDFALSEAYDRLTQNNEKMKA